MNSIFVIPLFSYRYIFLMKLSLSIAYKIYNFFKAINFYHIISIIYNEINDIKNNDIVIIIHNANWTHTKISRAFRFL